MAKNYLFLISSFIAGFSLMTVELISTRILAPYVGTSLYTWTSVIGVILFGISIGSYFGGKLIDKYKSAKTIFYFFTLSSLSTAFIPTLVAKTQFLVLVDFPIQIIIVLISLALFFLPAVFIGAIYPALLKFYSEDISSIGKKSGGLSALWSVGSIFGVFLTGFYFIGYFGSNFTLFIIAAILFINGLFFYFPKIKTLIVLIVILSGAIYLPQLVRGQSNDIFSDESNYYNIRVIDANSDIFGKIRTLFLDFDSHSVEGLEKQSLNNHTEIYPVFSAFNPDIKEILVLGSGSGLMAKYLSKFYKDSRVTIVEIDPKVVKVAEEFFDLKSYPIKIVVSDARVFLAKNSEKYDLIVNDVYNSFISVPWHLTTKEFNDLAKSRLNKGGIYAVNFISALVGGNADFFKSMRFTFQRTFSNYQIFSFGFLPTKGQNIILVGIDDDIQLNPLGLKEKLKFLENGEFLSSVLMTKKFSDDNSIILTDNFAPVEKLMVPLINDYFLSYAKLYYPLLF